ncbi:MAG: hypothetical protein HYY36_00020 [Gammaproteobacteria bacterium]|nr:hypothetical protein [Gammaproteobacteria bacterium]
MLKVGDIGILQHLHRPSLNGQIAEVIGELKPRLLYSLTDPAQSEQCAAYAVRVPGFPSPRDRITWCVKAHQIRPLEDPDATFASNGGRKRNRRSGLETALELPQVP